MRLVLYQPDIPQNTGTLLRFGSCMGLKIEVIEPCGFLLDDKRLKRAGLDYLDRAGLRRHPSWQDFLTTLDGRLILMTTKASRPYTEIAFQADDILLFGRESVGVPDEVHARADERLIIPMHAGERSLNLAISAAMVAGEALRQTKLMPQTVLQTG